MSKNFFTFGILVIILAGIFAPAVALGQTPLGTCTTPGTFGGPPTIVQNVPDCTGAGRTWVPNSPSGTPPPKSDQPIKPETLVTCTINGVTQTATKAACDASKGASAPIQPDATGGKSDWSLSGAIFESFAKGISWVILVISSRILGLMGLLFDEIVKFTITNMSQNMGPEGLGKGITAAWATMRDMANMVFIFVLLYAAFRAMFDSHFSNFGNTVKNIVIVALLINFSLFFTKFVIDASNIVAIGFYRSIATQTTTSLQTGGTTTEVGGISAGYMKMLGLQSIWDPKILTNDSLGGWQLLVYGMMSSALMLIVSVILLVVNVMFASRFVILIFSAVISALAAVAYVIPGQKKHFETWLGTLQSQALFAPLYFAMTWVSFKLANPLITVLAKGGEQPSWADMSSYPKGAIPLLLNYVLVIGFTIAALVISKQVASKAVGFKQISGGIAGGTIGGLGILGRQTFGRGANWVSETQRERLSKSAVGRAGLWVADRGKKGTFDVRGIETVKKVPGLGKETDILGKPSTKGFAKLVSEKVERKAKYAKEMYGQTEREKAEAKELEDKYNMEKLAEENRIRNEREEKLGRLRREATASGDRRELDQYEKKLTFLKKNRSFEDSEYSDKFNMGIKKEYEQFAKAGERRIKEFAKRVEGGAPISTTVGTGVGAVSGSVIGAMAGPIGMGIGAAAGAAIGAAIGKAGGERMKIKDKPWSWAGNKSSAGKIRAELKAPSKEKKAADALAELTAEATPEPTQTPTPAAPTGEGGGETPPAGGANRFE